MLFRSYIFACLSPLGDWELLEGRRLFFIHFMKQHSAYSEICVLYERNEGKKVGWEGGMEEGRKEECQLSIRT